MSVDEVVLRGAVLADGSLQVSGPVGLPAGPVEVVVQPLPSPREGFFEVLDGVRAELAARGNQPRSAEEIDADLRQMRDEWEEHSRAIEKLQDDCARLRRKPV